MSYSATLTLPKGCTKVQEQEMMYLEGGGTGTLIKSERLYRLKASDCLDIRDRLTETATAATEVALLLADMYGIQFAIASAAVAALTVSAAVFFDRAAQGNGAAIYRYTYADDGATVNPSITGTYTEYGFVRL